MTNWGSVIASEGPLSFEVIETIIEGFVILKLIKENMLKKITDYNPSLTIMNINAQGNST